MQSKKGFSFVELLIILVFVFIILASLMPMITRRHMAPPEKADHGTYACYWERKADGSHILKQTFIKGKRTVVSDEATDVCKFDPPKKAKYFYVQLIGGGGGGKKLEWEDIDPATNEAYRVKGHSSLAKYPIVGQSGSNSYSQDMFDKKEYKALVNDHKIVLHADAGEGGVCDPELFKEFSCDHGEKDDVPFCMQNIPEGRKVGDINLSECSSLGCYISEYKYIKSKCPDGKINTENNSCDCSGVKVSIKKTDPVQYIEMLSQVAMTPDICYNDKHGAALPEHYRTESLSDYFGP